MRGLDFSSWQAMLSTLVGLAVITLIGVGIRLLVMQTMQQRRERENRQINERLRTLIAAYKVLGGSFTGTLDVDPRHRRDFRALPDAGEDGDALHLPADADIGGERARRIRDAVEAALSDIILLGTDEQVRLAAHAANEMAQGRLVPGGVAARLHSPGAGSRSHPRRRRHPAPRPGTAVGRCEGQGRCG